MGGVGDIPTFRDLGCRTKTPKTGTRAVCQHMEYVDTPSFEPDRGVARPTPGEWAATSNEKNSLMIEAPEPSTHPPPHHRQTKFTPENIRQIQNLVDRGKSAEEIAEIIGVTPGTLRATCSKLCISLRRPRFDMGTGLLRQRRRPIRSAKHKTEHRAGQPHADMLLENQPPNSKDYLWIKSQ